MGSGLLALVAGVVTLLNPCVLPVVPIVVASALDQNRLGPVALAAGLVAAFVAAGMLIVTVGFTLGLDQDLLRNVAASVLLAAGMVLALPPAQAAFARISAPVAGTGNRWLAQASGRGAQGQFLVGALLGLVWAPCVGPTLGVAIAAASQGEDLTSAAFTFFLFGIGVAMSLLAVAFGTRRLFGARRLALGAFAHRSKTVLGVMLALVGAAILTGLDKRAEAAMVAVMPDWLIEFTTRF